MNCNETLSCPRTHTRTPFLYQSVTGGTVIRDTTIRDTFLQKIIFVPFKGHMWNKIIFLKNTNTNPKCGNDNVLLSVILNKL